MLLDLGHVVADVVDLVHALGRAEDAGEDVADPVGDHLAVGEGVVDRRAHGPVVALALGRLERGVDELAVGQAGDAEGVLHRLDEIGGHLVAEAAAAAVDHDQDLARGLEPEGPGRGLVEDLEDLLDLQEVVARAERAELGDAPLHGPFGDVLGGGVLHPAALLGPLEVLLPAVAVLDGPLRALDEDVLEHGPAELRDAALPHPGRDLLEDLGQQLPALGRDVVLRVSPSAGAGRRS